MNPANPIRFVLRLALYGWLLLTATVLPASGGFAGAQNAGAPAPALLPAWLPPAPSGYGQEIPRPGHDPGGGEACLAPTVPCPLLDPALARALAQAGPDDILPAIVVLREQAALTPTPAASGGFPLPLSRSAGEGEGAPGAPSW
jgi:hypothetical protein